MTIWILIDCIVQVRLQYSSCVGGARVGKLVKDMDLFAAIILYKHIRNPLIPIGEQDAFTAHKCMTLRMDHLHIKEKIRYFIFRPSL